MDRLAVVGRWVAFACVVAAISLGCVRLGFWQWHRMETKDANAAAMRKHLTDDPVALEDAQEEWTRVRVTGRFLVDRQVTVKYLVREGAPGVDVVTPLVLQNGRCILIDRGWMKTANDDQRPEDIPAPPRGVVTVEGWWRPDSGAEGHAIRPVDGQVRAIASRGLRSYVGRPLVPGYVNQQKPVARGLAPEPIPHLTSTLNFFYALQWWFFAALAGIGLPWMAWRQPERVQAKATKSV